MRFPFRPMQAVLLCTLALGGNRAFARDSLPVTITNTPVPVTVTNPITSVQVSNSAPIPVTATNALAVSGEVTVANTVPVRVVGREASQPFQRQFTLDWQDGQDLATGTYQVPPGKRLVIDYASLFAFLQPGGQSMTVRIVTTVNGSDGFNTLALQRQADYGVLPQFGAAHLVRIYADPGSTVRVSVGRTPFTSTASCTVTLSGHFEDVP